MPLPPAIAAAAREAVARKFEQSGMGRCADYARRHGTDRRIPRPSDNAKHAVENALLGAEVAFDYLVRLSAKDVAASADHGVVFKEGGR